MKFSKKIAVIFILFVIVLFITNPSYALTTGSDLLFSKWLIDVLDFKLANKFEKTEGYFIKIYTRKDKNGNCIVTSIAEDNCLIQAGLLADDNLPNNIPLTIASTIYNYLMFSLKGVDI
jgi:hypothetical protein